MRIKYTASFLIVFTLILVVLPDKISAHAAEILSLQECIDIALKQSLTIHSARESVAAAEAMKKEAFTAFLPKFSTSYNYTKLNEAPTFFFPGVPPLVPPFLLTTGTRDNYSWTVEAKQILFSGGGILAQYKARSLETDIAKMEEIAAIQNIIRDVKVAYFLILKAEKILEVARQSLKQLKAHRDMAQHFFQVGMIPRNDLLHAEVELANGQQFLLKSENAAEMAKARLNTILRRGIDTPIKVEDVFTQDIYEKSLEECLALAMKHRPEIHAHTYRVEQAKSEVTLARSEFFPTVSLLGNYTRYGDEPRVSGSQYKDRENWYVMALAHWNLWEWGKSMHRVEASKSRENQSNDTLSHLKDQIVLEVKNAYLMVREAERQIEVTRKAIDQAEENYRITVERFREQVATSTDVLDAQTLLTRARSDYANALGDLNINRATLERALGIVPELKRSASFEK